MYGDKPRALSTARLAFPPLALYSLLGDNPTFVLPEVDFSHTGQVILIYAIAPRQHSDEP